MANSKLVLGTVQLGMQYGIGNTTGKPDEQTAVTILDAAYNGGITCLDTAAAYGTAEVVVGGWVGARYLSDKVKVISKLPPSPGGDTRSILAAVTASLRRLNIRKLDGYLLHSPADMVSQAIVEGMKAARDAGHTAHIGVSAYEPEQAAKVIELGFDYIQVPYNVFDRRLDASGFFDLARERGVTVFVRSTFLQGLLLMEPHAVPHNLSQARPFVERFRTICSKHGLSPLEAALSYACNHPGIDHVVFGVETPAQLHEILNVDTSGHELCLAELKEIFADVDPTIIDPRTWPKKD